MTMKSAGRIARDAATARNKKQLAENTCWDDLSNIYRSCTDLLQRHTHLAQYANNKELLAEITDTTTLAGNIRLLASDINKLASELKEIQAQHIDKTGGSPDPDEVIHSIGIFEQYNLFMERHEAVVMPTVLHILEQFDQAEHSLLKKKQAQAEQANELDPTVVTDVQFTDTVKPQQ